MIIGSPFVYWAQDYSRVTLRIDLKDARKPDVQPTKNSLEFSAKGVGARGENRYGFKIDLYDDIKPERTECRVTDRQVEVVLYKRDRSGDEDEWWPRLCYSRDRLPWLKVDFDRFAVSDSEPDDDPANDKHVDQIYEELLGKDERRLRKRAQDLRKVYLFLYNLFQFCAFLTIGTILFIRYLRHPEEVFQESFRTVGGPMKFALLLQTFEIIHPLLGFVPRGGFLPALILISGRLFMFFAMISAEPRMHSKPAVTYLFAVYTAIELVRYPYYMLKVYNMSIGLLTWLRYTLWVVLLPIGFVCEGVIILRNIPYFEETNRFSVHLPNAYNWSFHLPTLMRLYLLVGIFPLLAFMMSHMYTQRKKALYTHSKRKRD
ncbi:very-long-chain (3R)-3-hydroxyacyl-CoA dehydratase-like [Varroa jacobsoni]|uniref:Very-long-chain (3R)-3-hydroxyacyl-CoA dehydratase n=1 Tax=Varroa destructor TaxID=109461 RepID=A0A7M7M7L6_VARDE|nr:very-long-chain (3R)-3-hydroxyacyl-CoA dehydratase 3-like [Varroa destructor]XP_022701809.1 very-long-chain (3R)-3-hydroxyacyl-CoA dehydratase-like [Varroa jacobsoni]